MENSKKFVLITDNKCPEYLIKHVKIGDSIVVSDGSYMMDENEQHVNGLHFVKEGLHELLKVVDINKPFPTDLSDANSLTYYNNCKIQGADDKIYYCSKVNIKRFEF